jgi:hypothetical protein
MTEEDKAETQQPEVSNEDDDKDQKLSMLETMLAVSGKLEAMEIARK